MPIQSRQLRAFDLIEFDGSTNVASVRKIVTEDGEQVAILRYMRDDGELDFAPFTLTVRAILKICSIRDEGVSRNTRRPVLVGCQGATTGASAAAAGATTAAAAGAASCATGGTTASSSTQSASLIQSP